MPRILSVSGLRGVVGDGLDADFLTRFGQAVGTLAMREPVRDGVNRGLVVLTRDGRPTGSMVRHCVVGGLLAAGCRVLDGGVAMTPTCGVLVQHHGAAAGLQITASHNPLEWNGLKPFSPSGGVLNAEQGQELVALLESGEFAAAGWDGVGSVETLADPHGPHLRRVLALVDREAIRAKRFKVVLDCNRGSGGAATPGFLRDELGCEVVVLGETPDGLFEHTPEPTEANLTGLCDEVRRHGADVGFAQDPDADRLAVVDENGRYIGEELTLALCADHVLATCKGPLVVNGSTSRVNADVAERRGCAFHRSAVGEANVVGEMNRVGAALGGEGNGGVIEPKVGPVRDSLVSIAYLLDGLAKRGGSVGAWADSLPQYAIVKKKFAVPSPDRVNAACDALAAAYPDAEAKWGDGLRLDWPDRWVQVRASNTEPIARVIAEAPGADVSEALAAEATAICERAAA
ncbi:phosphoglucosamine mutase [Alienimonas chondri]|uniref:Phosphoglucosamine mutase n=1 Tax=Alienimonas chondri TaxID=2681879 RepID=A0ABX1VAD6_9PLAN|nr:phosphoglucosamine mutase [Alienimonas chondri]NNJ24881.1 Phosphoglucosamine mutase [Alienimonas chondri]